MSEEQLIAYVHDEADSLAQDHVRRCPYCAERVRAYVADLGVLHALFHRVECPDAHTLGEFQRGLLSASEQAAIEDHLKICSECAAEVAEMDRFLREVPIVPAVPPLPQQLKRLVARLAPPAPTPLAAQPALALRGPALALRGAAAAVNVYRAEDIRVVVGLETDGLRAGRRMLLGFTAREGQPLASLSGAQVQLTRGGEAVAVELIDTLGNFTFSDLISGAYELTLVTDREQVVIETIVV